MQIGAVILTSWWPFFENFSSCPAGHAIRAAESPWKQKRRVGQWAAGGFSAGAGLGRGRAPSNPWINPSIRNNEWVCRKNGGGRFLELHRPSHLHQLRRRGFAAARVHLHPGRSSRPPRHLTASRYAMPHPFLWPAGPGDTMHMIDSPSAPTERTPTKEPR